MTGPAPSKFLFRIDSKYYPLFKLKMAYENASRIRILFYITCFFLPAFFVLDYIRIRQGLTANNILYQLLVVDHFLFCFMLVASGQAWVHRKKLNDKDYPQVEKLVNIFIGSLIVAMMPASILTIYDRDTLVLFTIYSVVLNIILELDHRKSVWLNVSSFIISLIAVLFYNTSIETQLVTTMELIAVYGIPFIISRRQYALKLREFEFQNILNEQNIVIQNEKDKSDKLLLNILPVEIAEELKETGAIEAHQFEKVTVLFTDFVNFTGISELLTPQQLVAEIHHCFKNFDEIIERNGLEKIKTIGDAYLAVSGLPKSNTHYPKNAVKAAIEIIEFIESYKKEKQFLDNAGWGVRIGINSGPVIAGIVGVKKFAYDIWGDTVNTAARMEQCSEPGKINVSINTFELVKNDFTFNHRGKIEAKNKGMIDMYFVEM